VLARLRHLWLLVSQGPLLLINPHLRSAYRQALALSRSLPSRLKQPLPESMAALAAHAEQFKLPELSAAQLRRTADLAALLDRASPLGLCLRRSLTRYVFLRSQGLPVEVKFGARFKNELPDRPITGHAWVTLHGRPYFEDDQNWRNFTVMLSFPQGKA
jgi:hypothetical protein